MNFIPRRFARNALFKGYRMLLDPGIPDHNGFFRAYFDFYKWDDHTAHLLIDTSTVDRDRAQGKIFKSAPELMLDDTGRLSAETLAIPVQINMKWALYKGHRVRVSKMRPSEFLFWGQEPNLFIVYSVPDGEPVPETIDWIPHAVRSKNGIFSGHAPISEEAFVLYDEGCYYKMACFKGFSAIVKTTKDGICAIEFAVPEPAQYEDADWLIQNFKQESFDTFSGMIPLTDPGLYIDDTEIIREDLLTHTFPVNWRAAEYKGCKIMVGAHSDTHHFVTHHAGIFLPRGVIPAFLSSVTATQTGPQDFMAKIPIGDPDLIFMDPQKHPDN